MKEDKEPEPTPGYTKDSDGNSGVPYLKDIPYIGKLFQTQINSGEMSDLLIFVTPRIIKPKIIRADDAKENRITGE